jgi:glycosyltransferase involved in cell wall biosynthesis
MKKKIAFITNNSYIIDMFITSSINKLSEDLDIYIISNIDNPDYYQNINAKTIWIPISRNPNFFKDLYALFYLIFILKNIKPDITHSLQPKSGFIGSIASFMCRIPKRCHTFTGQVWKTNKGIKRVILKTMDRLICKLSTDILSDSKSQSLFIKNELKIKQDIDVLGEGSLGGVNLSKWKKNLHTYKDVHKRTSFKNGITFAYIARKKRDKGAHDVIRIFKKFQTLNIDSNLLYLGPVEDNVPSDVACILDELKDSIYAVDGIVNGIEYLNISDVLLLPSYREGFGSIVINAAAMGIPTIAYNCYGLTDSVSNENGYLVEEGDISDFVNKMFKIFHDIEDNSQKVTYNCKNWASKFSSEIYEREFTKFHKSIAERGSN